jgi:membrane protease YdiL (CAAX protease family)
MNYTNADGKINHASDIFAAAVIIQLIGSWLLLYVGAYAYQSLTAEFGATAAFLTLLLTNSVISYLPMTIAAGVIHAAAPLNTPDRQPNCPDPGPVRRKLSPLTFMGLLALMVFFAQCAYLLTAIIGGLVAPGWDAQTQPDAYLPQDNLQLTMYFIAFGAVAPVCEELFFRGFLFRRLAADPSLSGMKITVLTSAAFALFHGNMAQIPYALCAGFILGYLRLRTGSVKTTIILHMVYNFAALLPVMAAEFNYLLLLLTLAGGVYGVVLIVRHGIKLPAPTKRSFTLSVGVWAAAAMYVGYTVYRML